MNFINTSAYKFVNLPLARLPLLRQQLQQKADDCQLKGTILLSQEGINSFLSGTREAIDDYKRFLEFYPEFCGLQHKESASCHQPFSRMLVRLKKEIISMGRPEVRPQNKTAPHLLPETLKAWYQQQKSMIVLDVRNDYEVALGSFDGAVDLHIETFRHFPDAAALLPNTMKTIPIVTFCTGGIRCEKAGQYLLNQGFREVYQLAGGVLAYFEHCGGEFWQGECFVFDKRVAVNSQLQETATAQCYGCRSVLTVAQQCQPCSNCGSEGHIRPSNDKHTVNVTRD